MKKQLLLAALSGLLLYPVETPAQRFLSEVFSSVLETQNVAYANNFSFLTGMYVAQDLYMDVYEPGGCADPMPQRPLVVLLHTGSFLPTFINGTPTGNRRDSTVVEMARQLARRGYVVAAMSYRLGWNPQATGGGANEDIRRGSLLQAVYRAIQDAKACVRYFHKDQATTNTFRIDSTAVILGGIGSGGYIALAYATLDLVSEISLPKFLSNNTVPAPYNFMPGVPYVIQSELGDFDGFGGNPAKNNAGNSPGYTNDVQFVFNMGGALGDSIWMASGDAPMVSFHVVGDPFAPYGYGPVIVPGTLDYVVHVSGSSDVIRLATQFGNENCFNAAGFTDPYTVKANQGNNGYDGLFPFYTNPAVQAGPWEWFDSLATVAGAQLVGLSAAQGAGIYANALLTNPDMSKAKGLAYIDTTMGYMNPRVVYCLGLDTAMVCPSSTEELTGESGLSVFPNPAGDFLNVRASASPLRQVDVMDLSGRIVLSLGSPDSREARLDVRALPPGAYVVRIRTTDRSLTVPFTH